MARVLIVEDDALTCRLYQKALESGGFQVDTAQNGLDGLTLLRKNTPTLVLLDIMMPEMDGIEFLQELKLDEATKNIPVVVLTNLAEARDAEKALEMGAVKFIVKSETKPGDVLDEVNKIIGAYTRDEIPQA